MENSNYLEIKVSGEFFIIPEEDVERIMLKPLLTRLPFLNSLVCGMVFDGREMVPLLDLTKGRFSKEKEFGNVCILLHRGNQKLAAAVTEIGRTYFQEESEQDTIDLFSLVFNKMGGEDSGGH
ncbi:MAG: chemotaxis protein CheW [Lachnospiraceae bacterium]|nr:chemotaxis protein CheW [Lachnospiraceae bacterium]